MDVDRFATRPREVNAAARALALRQLRWQQREWARNLATHAPGTPCLIASADRARITGGLDLLREAGEDIPSWLYQRGSLVSVSLTDLMADLTRVLARFDPEPGRWPQGVSADAGRGPGGVKPPAWIVGDRVTARATAITVWAGSCGTVVGFSGVGGHPLVDFDGPGRVLIRAEHLRAEHLECDDDGPAKASSPGRPRASDTTRLSATPRPPTVAATPPPPPPDWFDRLIATTSN
jgi:hypothetical protein